MDFISLRKMTNGQWRAINEPDTYASGSGLHTTEKVEVGVYKDLPVGWGATPQEALMNLLKLHEEVSN